ncbi:unnamed protein product [Microthlaspi erraticum]|uniref:Pentatricopeptide repeat-containing protein n=1 Tax=Microthlaspi erraticum TaxID=1685480 RepID=A0A6D2IW30_9BRAS|nr:unnamed protein product [Microthlaspi erraticum]
MEDIGSAHEMLRFGPVNFIRSTGLSVHSPVRHLSCERMLARHFFMGELTVNWFGTDFARCFVRTSHEKGQRPAKTLFHSLARRSVDELRNGFGTELAHDSARHDICTGDGVKTDPNNNQKKAIAHLKDMQRREMIHDLFIYTIMINTNGRKQAIALFKEMQRGGIKPDVVKYTVLLNNIPKRDTKTGMEACDVQPDVFYYRVLIDHQCKIGYIFNYFDQL